MSVESKWGHCHKCGSENVRCEQAEDGRQGTEYHAIVDVIICRDCGARETL